MPVFAGCQGQFLEEMNSNTLYPNDTVISVYSASFEQNARGKFLVSH